LLAKDPERKKSMASKNFVNLAVNNLNKPIDKNGNPMPRIRSLEGREAGIVATAIQGLFHLMLGRTLNPIKVQAHSSRIMLSSFLSNAILGSGRWKVGKDLVHLVRTRTAARNGCLF
jgi:hypothetical protein